MLITWSCAIVGTGTSKVRTDDLQIIGKKILKWLKTQGLDSPIDEPYEEYVIFEIDDKNGEIFVDIPAWEVAYIGWITEDNFTNQTIEV